MRKAAFSSKSTSRKGDNGQMIHREYVEIPPDKTLMPKLGLGGYSIPQAIAELIDNAIDAQMEGARLHVDVSFDSSKVVVMDDGAGMNAAGLRDAMRLAFSQKEGKLGEFGLGLKTACTSLGRQFEVRTSTTGDRWAYTIRYDEAAWLGGRSDEWKLPLEREDKKDPLGHGTQVTIRQLKVKTAGLVTRLRRDLSQRFAPYIAAGEVEVKVNSKKCAPMRPELMEGTRKQFEVVVDGNRIHGWYGLLKHGSQRGLYGFHTYRRGRMITAFDKIGIPEHPTMARIIGEIHFDHVPVTHNKREFIRESEEYQSAAAALEEEFKELVKMAREAAGPDRVTPNVREKLDTWKDCIQEALKEPELQGYSLPAGGSFERVNPREVPDSVPQVVEVELRSPAANEASEIPELKNERERLPKETHPQRRNTIRIKGRQFEYMHEFRPLGLQAAWKAYSINDERRLIEIFTNTDFPAYYTTRDVAFYAVLHISESIAEIMVSRSGEPKEKANEVREVILRHASRIKNQVEDEE